MFDMLKRASTQAGATKLSGTETAAIVDSLSRSQAMIEFEPDGTIITANENFQAAMGYSLDEVAGEHHRKFVEPSYAASAEYARFWEELRNGETHELGILELALLLVVVAAGDVEGPSSRVGEVTLADRRPRR